MRSKSIGNLLAFALFGVALGFFGILYEGIVYGPKLLDTSMDRMLFWKGFTSVISPVIYYVPLVHLATITLVFLYVRTPKERTALKGRLKWASLFQLLSLVLTIYILTQVDLKGSFGDLEHHAEVIPHKVLLFNVLSIVRIAFGAMALVRVFQACLLVLCEQLLEAAGL